MACSFIFKSKYYKLFTFIVSSIIAVVLGLSLEGCQSSGKLSSPNIILIAVDDLGYSDLGCYGSEINTPNIDQLAQGGMRFRSFYNTSKCFPSRATLMTGVYAQDCGYHLRYDYPIKNAVTIGEVLRARGYQTYWVGKHHGVENPVTRGFDHYYGLLDGAANHFNPGKQRPGEQQPAQKRADRKWAIDSTIFQPYTPPAGFYTTDVFTDYAVKYLEESKLKEDPFFLYLSYTAPHDPLMAWPEDISRYEGMYDHGYEKIRRSRFQKQKILGLMAETDTLSEASFIPWDELTEQEQKEEADKMEVYAAMIDRVDQNIGRLMTTLTNLKYDQHTLIFFVSDNGASAEVVNLMTDNDQATIGDIDRWVSLGRNWANVSNTPFRLFKNHSFEGGINTPMIAYWPGRIEPNSFSDFPGHFIDFMATIVDVAGATYPVDINEEVVTPMRGKSLLPTFELQHLNRKEPLYWEWAGGQAMRLDDWKIVRGSKYASWELYHLSSDKVEMKNLAAVYPDKINVMDSIYQQWYDQHY